MSDNASSPHRGAVAVLGPPSPSNPLSRVFLAGKAAAATAVALWLDALVGNPDHVTSTFVAVLCISPVLLMGLRSALDQLAGSVLGGLWGTGCALLGLSLIPGIPIAVGGAIVSCFGLSFGRGYPVAAFTALFVQAVPRGEPGETFVVRMTAVSIAAISGFAVNAGVSALAYRSIFRRRLRYASRLVSRLLVRAAEEGPRVARAGFPVLAALQNELELAEEELGFRRSRRTIDFVRDASVHAERLRRLLHLVVDLADRLDEEGLPADAMKEWLTWLAQPGGPEPPVPTPLKATTRRIRRLGRRIAEDPPGGPKPEDGDLSRPT